MYNQINNLIKNKDYFIYNENKSDINKDCIINSIQLLKYYKDLKLFQMPCSVLDKVYLYIYKNQKWIIRVNRKNIIKLYKFNLET